MKKFPAAFASLAAASVALLCAPRVHAQIETFDTITSYNGIGVVGFTGGNTDLTQTFTNVLELSSVTYQFTTTGADSTAQNISAYLVQWNTTTSDPDATFTAPATVSDAENQPNAIDAAPVAESTTPLTSFTIPPAGTGAWQTDTFQSGGNYNGYDVTLSINQLLDPALTYGIVLIDTTNASGLGLLQVDGAFNGYGLGYQDIGNTSLTQMESDNSNTNSLALSGRGADYGFSQIVIVPAGNMIPVPESRTAASVLCALFVAVLVGRQLILRRQESAGESLLLAA